MVNEDVIDYIFKTKGLYLSDSSLSETKGLREELDALLTNTSEEELYSPNNLELQEYEIDRKLSPINTIQEERREVLKAIDYTILKRGAELQDKINTCKGLVNSAMLAEKGLASEVYTAVLPITSEYAVEEGMTATIKDNTVFGINSKKLSGEDFIDINTVSITGEEYTSFKIRNATGTTLPITIEFDRNDIKNFNQIRVSLPQVIKSGVLSIKFKETQVISVLNSDNLEIIEKQVRESITIPVTTASRSLKIRFHSRKARTVTLLSCSYTEKIYTEAVQYETKPIAIQQEFSSIAIETCDNYQNSNVSLDYFVSLNGSEYEAFRPVGKFRSTYEGGKAPQSIIRIDKYSDNDIIEMNAPTLEDGVFKFRMEELIPSNALVTIFEDKFNKEVLTLNGSSYNSEASITLHIVLREAITLTLNTNQSIKIDDSEYVSLNGNKDIKVEKGIRKLTFDKSLWKEPIDLSIYDVVSIEQTELTVVDRATGEESTVPHLFNTLQASTNSLYLQLKSLDVPAFLTKRLISKKIDDSYVSYYYKENSKPLYFTSALRSKLLNTVQIKVILTSLDKTTCPYISKMIVKGL